MFCIAVGMKARSSPTHATLLFAQGVRWLGHSPCLIQENPDDPQSTIAFYVSRAADPDVRLPNFPSLGTILSWWLADACQCVRLWQELTKKYVSSCALLAVSYGFLMQQRCFSLLCRKLAEPFALATSESFTKLLAHCFIPASSTYAVLWIAWPAEVSLSASTLSSPLSRPSVTVSFIAVDASVKLQRTYNRLKFH